MSSLLCEDILKAYTQLIHILDSIPVDKRQSKIIDGTGGKVSPVDLIAYQIGWANCLIRWYKAGIKGKSPEIPGDGFSKWEYVAIAKHFYKHYQYDALTHQMAVFEKLVFQILEITKKEEQTGNLYLEGVWPWCTLSSGKKWPLGKWIRVNTVSPYRRAIQLLKGH